MLSKNDFRDLVAGFYKNLPDFVYHSVRKGVASNSILGHVEEGIASYAKFVLEPFKRTEALDWGSAYHTLILEPDLFPYRVNLHPACDGQTAAKKPCKNPAKYMKGIDRCFCGTHVPKAKKSKDPAPGWETLDQSDIVFLKQGELDALKAMRDRLMAHPIASELLKGGSTEGAVVWKDAETGTICKGKIDHWHTGYNALIDLKTTRDASREGFRKSLYDWGYYRQGPMYLDGANTVSDTKLTDFVFIAQEKKPPYMVGVHMLDRRDHDVGRDKYQDDLRKFTRFQEIMQDEDLLEKEINKGYSADIMPIALPGWAVDRVYESLE